MNAGASSLWSLVEARALASPDAMLAVDESGRTLTFAEFRAAAESAAAGLASLGVNATSRVSWQLPTWLESFVLVGALCRLGALQNPMLPIYRERELRFVLGEVRPELLVVAGEWRGFDHRRAADSVVAELHDAVGLECRVLTCDRALPRGDPATLPATAGGRRRAALGLLLVGHDGGPEGCAALRTRRSSRAPAASPSASSSTSPTATRWCSRSRTSGESGCSWSSS